MSNTKKTAIDPMNARLVAELEEKLIALDKQFEAHNKIIRPQALMMIQSIKIGLNNLEHDYIRYLTAQREDGKGIHLNLSSDGAAWFFNKEAISEKLPELAFRIIGNTTEHQRFLNGSLSYSQIVKERNEIRAQLAALTEQQPDQEEQAAA